MWLYILVDVTVDKATNVRELHYICALLIYEFLDGKTSFAATLSKPWKCTPVFSTILSVASCSCYL